MEFVPPVIAAAAGSMTDTKAFKVKGQPPAWIFPVVWTFLYWTLAVSNLWQEPLYYVNLVCNAMWTKVYFEDRTPVASDALLYIMIATAIYLAMKRPLLWFYVAWLFYALWLSKNLVQYRR